MMNNNFEKRIKDKLNRFEVEPSENLLENIMEQRAVKYKAVLRLSYLKLGVAMLGLVIVSVIVWLNRPSSGTLPVQGDSGTPSAIAQESTSASEQPEKTSGSVNADQAVHSGQASAGEKVVMRPGDHSEKGRTSGYINAGDDKRSSLLVNRRREKQNTRSQDKPSSKDIKMVSARSNGEVRNNSKEKISYGTYNDNGENIAERYFNIDAKNRPLIAATYHRGQSHLMVYHSVDKDMLDQLNLNYLFLQPMRHYAINNINEDKLGLLDYQRFANNKVSRRPVFIDLMVTPLFTYQSIKGNENYNSMAVMGMNKQYGGRVSVPVSDRISVFSGVTYTELNTRYKGQFEHAYDAVRYEKVTTYINDPVLGTIPVTHTDTINYVKKDQINYNFRNVYRIFSVPVGLSYNFGVKKFDFAVHGSAIVNIMTSARGSNVDFVSDQSRVFESGKKQMGIGAGLSFMAAYQISNRIKVFVEPGLQYYRINGAKTGNIVSERVLNNGLSLGLRYTLF